MKLLFFMTIMSGLVSCVQIPESVQEDLENAANQTGQESSLEYDDYYRDGYEDDDHNPEQCTEYGFIEDEDYLWNGQGGGLEVGYNGVAMGDSNKPGRVVVHDGGEFSYGWRDRQVGQVYALDGSTVKTPRHADIYAKDGSVVDLSNGRDVLVYAEYGAQIVNQEYCRSCAIYYQDDVDVDGVCHLD